MNEGGAFYRRDIDGLRAIAILTVVGHHARVPGFAGGFIGVDVFFVISGFLITAILVAEARRTGTVSLPAFYARCIRRLFPAMVVVVLATCILGAIVLGMVGIHKATASPRAGLERRLGRLMSDSMESELEAVATFETFRRGRTRRLPIIGMFLAGRSGMNQLAEDLERADIRLTVSEFVAVRIFVTAIFVGVPYVLLGGILGMAAGAGIGFVGYLIPRLWVARAKGNPW